jgi:biotin carboxyl carrier protein
VSEPELTIIPLGDGRYQVVEGSRRRIAYAVHSSGDTWVFIDGRVHVIASERTSASFAKAPAARDDDMALSAPMPATVTSVQVEPGQAVSRGDVLVMLEAMKMELAVKAPREGVVRRIACREGELVQPGVPLLDLD